MPKDRPYRVITQRDRARNVWGQIIRRCTKPHACDYHRYGGRGIGVADEWLDFEVFYAWAIANGYKKGLQIHRLDNDGDYAPSNCAVLSLEDHAELHAVEHRKSTSP